MKQYKTLYFLGLFLIFNQSQIVNSAQKENSFYDIISRENFTRVIRQSDTLIHQYNQLKNKAKNLLKIDTLSKEEVDKLNEYLVKIKKNIGDLAENTVALENFPNEYEKRKKLKSDKNSSNTANEFLSDLSFNTKKNFKERENRIDVMQRDYNESKLYINRIESEKVALPAASSGQPSTGATVSAITGKYTEKEAKEAVILAKKEKIEEIDTKLQNNNNYSNIEKRKIYKLVTIIQNFKKKFTELSEEAREAMYEDFFEKNGVDNLRVQDIIIRDFINPEETSEKSSQNASQKAAAASSSVQPKKYTEAEANFALSESTRAKRNIDETKRFLGSLLSEDQVSKIMELVNVINDVKANKTDSSLEEKLEVAERNSNVKIIGTKIEKIILDGIKEQLSYQKADEDFRRNLAQLEEEESKATSNAQRDALEQEEARMRSELESELESGLENELAMIKQEMAKAKSKAQREALEEQQAQLRSQLEQQSIDKSFMDKVAKNASSWITKLSGDKQVTQAAVRKLLEKDAASAKNLTDAQVLYINGFLQAMKL